MPMHYDENDANHWKVINGLFAQTARHTVSLV